MTNEQATERAELALLQRLTAVAPFLVADAIDTSGDCRRDTSILVDVLSRAVHAERTPERLWLLHVAVAGTFPTSEWIRAADREFELSTPTVSTIWLLDTCRIATHAAASAGRELRMLAGGTVIDVDNVAQNDMHTGIQQVIRSFVPLWDRDHDITLAAWFPGGSAMRALTEVEEGRVLRWSEHVPSNDYATESRTIIVPWRSVIVMPDAPRATAAEQLSALGSCTNNQVMLVGHDCIPAISPHLLAADAADVFLHFLTIVKHSRRIAAVSDSARREFQGFVDTLAAQGLTGPAVVACPLASVRPEATAPGDAEPGPPVVLTVGSFEPRKNHLAVLHAAETLWREGSDFELVMIGGGGSGSEIPDRIAELQAGGRPLTVLHRAPDSVLQAAFARARFLVFPSLHEGFGLPVVEALAKGTPVITSDFGSMAESATAGGALTINPRDDLELIRAMRRLLTDDQLLDELSAQIRNRPDRGWEDYARELWDCLMRPEVNANVDLTGAGIR